MLPGRLICNPERAKLMCMPSIIQTVKTSLPTVYKQVNQISSPGFTPWSIKHKIGKVSQVILQLPIYFLGLWRSPSGASSALEESLTSLDRGTVRVREEVLLRQRTNRQHTSSIAKSDSAGHPHTHTHSLKPSHRHQQSYMQNHTEPYWSLEATVAEATRNQDANI